MQQAERRQQKAQRCSRQSGDSGLCRDAAGRAATAGGAAGTAGWPRTLQVVLCQAGEEVVPEGVPVAAVVQLLQAGQRGGGLRGQSVGGVGVGWGLHEESLAACLRSFLPQNAAPHAWATHRLQPRRAAEPTPPHAWQNYSQKQSKGPKPSDCKPQQELPGRLAPVLAVRPTKAEEATPTINHR